MWLAECLWGINNLPEPLEAWRENGRRGKQAEIKVLCQSATICCYCSTRAIFGIQLHKREMKWSCFRKRRDRDVWQNKTSPVVPTAEKRVGCILYYSPSLPWPPWYCMSNLIHPSAWSTFHWPPPLPPTHTPHLSLSPPQVSVRWIVEAQYSLWAQR